MVAEQLRRPVSGIGTYIRGLLHGLDGCAEAEVTLWASRPPRGRPDPLAAFGRPVETSLLPGPAMTRLWDRGVGRLPARPEVVPDALTPFQPAGNTPTARIGRRAAQASHC